MTAPPLVANDPTTDRVAELIDETRNRWFNLSHAALREFANNLLTEFTDAVTDRRGLSDDGLIANVLKEELYLFANIKKG